GQMYMTGAAPRGMSPQVRAAYTGRVEAIQLMQRLLEQPCPEEFGKKYRLELLLTAEAVLKPAASKNCLQRLAEFLRSGLTSRSGWGLEDAGVLDHMVRMTTSLYSPAVAIVCQTVCPEDPPCVGKRRLAVQEILAAKEDQDTLAQEREEAEGAEQQFRTSEVVGGSREEAPRLSPPSFYLPVAQGSASARRKASLLPLQLLRLSSVRPGVVVPRVRISKAPAPTFQPERIGRKGNTKTAQTCRSPCGDTRRPRKKRRRQKRPRGSARRKLRRKSGHRAGGKGREGVDGQRACVRLALRGAQSPSGEEGGGGGMTMEKAERR
ncbi:Hypothetical predicted protein, partial [Marmota monax]